MARAPKQWSAGAGAGDGAARSFNRKAAEDYDRLIYDPSPPRPGFGGTLFGTGSLYGCAADMGDFLDLGCGTGRYLEAIGSEMTGRAVGVDLSAAAVEAARKLCVSLGGRAAVLQADFLDLTPAALGQFDLITNVGVHYVVPREVRRHLAMLMGECLRPGGLAVVSYYVGPMIMARIAIYRLLRGLIDPDAAPRSRIGAARRQLAAIAKAADSSTQKAIIEACVNSISGLTDQTLFHEVFNPHFEVLDTFGLAEELRPHGLCFLNFVQAATINGLRTSQERVASGAALDVLSGGYRFAIFGKTCDADAVFDINAPRVRWHLSARRLHERSRGEISVYQLDKGNQLIELAYPFADFALQQMEKGGATLAEVRAAGARQVPQFDTPADAERLEENLRGLWRMGVIVPERDR